MLTSDVIGERIKETRERKNLNQIELCESLKKYGVNISRETLSKIENGSRSLSAIELKALCETLSISSEDLLQDTQVDLITLFRRMDLGAQTISEVEELQELIKDFTTQKKLYTGELKIRKMARIWEV